jgi:hypothetical protein
LPALALASSTLVLPSLGAGCRVAAGSQFDRTFWFIIGDVVVGSVRAAAAIEYSVRLGPV